MGQELVDLFKKARKGPWLTFPKYDIQYKYEKEGNTLVFKFQGSQSIEDWKVNFNFFKKYWRQKDSYKNSPIKWRAHGGFLTAYKSIRSLLLNQVDLYKDEIERIEILGYSLGAAYATLCHEDIGFHFPQFQDAIFTYAFASPRVLSWISSFKLKKRFKGLTRIYVRGDLVTHVPFGFLGFRHVGKAFPVGRIRLIPRAFLHMPSNFEERLLKSKKTLK
jgi:hypothetical protein